MAIGKQQQDEYTWPDLCKKIDTLGGLEQGKYELDVSAQGTIKFSKIKKSWYQKIDFTKT